MARRQFLVLDGLLGTEAVRTADGEALLQRTEGGLGNAQGLPGQADAENPMLGPSHSEVPPKWHTFREALHRTDRRYGWNGRSPV